MIRQVVVLAACGVMLTVARAQDAAKDKDLAARLADYRTVSQAITTQPQAMRGSQSGYLGVAVAKDARGKLVVTDVQPGSPGEEAGILPGDVVVQLGGRPRDSVEAFREAIHGVGAGATIALELLRDDKTIETSAKLTAVSRPMKLGVERALLGAAIGEVREGEGAPVERVVPNSPAARAGLRPGDVVLRINGEQLTRASELTDSIAERKPGDTLTLTIQRNGAESEVKVQLAGDGGRGFGARGAPVAFTPRLWKQERFRLAVIPIEFPDVKHNEKIAATDWAEALFSRDCYQDRKDATEQPVHGSLNDYFHEQSYGKLRFEGKVFDWIEAGKKRMDYSQGSGTSNRTAVMTEAMDKLLARDGRDALNEFDGLFFLYAGTRVNTNRGALYYPHSGVLLHQNKRWPYVFAPEGGPRMTPLGTYATEVAQMLGLPSLAARTENAGSEGCGVWCVMSATASQTRPQHLCAWCKLQLGWITPAIIDPSVKQKLILAPITEGPNEYVQILVRPDGSEYFLLENRQKKGFDLELPGEGLLIWRVVENRPILEEAHGIEGPLGPRVQLQHVPYPSSANNAFTPETTPSSQSPKGGGMTVRITNIQRLPDGRIAFCVGHEFR